MSNDQTAIRQAVAKIEAARMRRGISVRDAASRVQHVSEGYWRQFVKGGVSQSGVWVPRIPTVDQVLKMASAVGVSDEIAADLGVEPPPEPDTGDLEAVEALLEQALAELNRLKREREKPA